MEKDIRDLEEMLNNINFHIEGLIGGFKKGVGDQELLDEYINKKNTIKSQLESLTNQY